jgi:hypothetical protein
MKEDICSIPVNEVLEVRDGCPICRMHHTLEEATLDFVLGAAMMEPDIRRDTNREGFCAAHFGAMMGRKNRLSLALMLQSHLELLGHDVFEKPGVFSREAKAARKAEEFTGSCYVCRRIGEQEGRLLHTFFLLWKKEREFRDNVAAQPSFCLPHYALLLERGAQELDKKSYLEFARALTDVTRKGLGALREDVDAFCRSFDYRNSGDTPDAAKDAVPRAVLFLTGRSSQ